MNIRDILRKILRKKPDDSSLVVSLKFGDLFYLYGEPFVITGIEHRRAIFDTSTQITAIPLVEFMIRNSASDLDEHFIKSSTRFHQGDDGIWRPMKHLT